MRILCALPTLRSRRYGGPVGGGEISNRLLLEGLAARGHEVTVVTSYGPQAHEEDLNGVTVSDVSRSGVGGRMPRPVSRLLYHGAVVRTVRGGEFDIIVAGTEAVPAAVAAGRESGVPVAVFVRSYEHFPRQSGAGYERAFFIRRRIKKALYGDFGIASLARADRLLASSDFLARECREVIGDGVVSVVYPPLDRAVVPTRQMHKVRTVLMVGTGPFKGERIVRRLAADHPGIRFRVVGCAGLGPNQEQVESNLERIGWCDTRYAFEHEADVVVVPSQWREAFGRVAVEALASGAVVLSSDIGGLPEAVNHERALLVEAGCEEAWSQRFRDLCANPGPYCEASRRAHVALDRFTDGAPVTVLENALMEVGEQHRGSHGAARRR